VHFENQRDFAATPQQVAGLMSDPEFQSSLDLPDLSRPVVVDHEIVGSSRRLRLRYEYIGQLDPIARRVVGGRKLTWLQELRVDLATGVGMLSFAAEEEADRVNGTAEVSITTRADDGSRRRIAGDFRIRLPVVGGTAERRIVPGLVRRLDVEADALSARLAADG
jgi:hypothetical protein